MSKFTYGYWRTDKPAEPGFSHELISSFTDKSKLDDLTLYPKNKQGQEIKTLTSALEQLAQQRPDHPWLGTKKTRTVNNAPQHYYEWMTVKEVRETAMKFGAGLMAMNLIPEVEGEGRMWRMLGIQSKNRLEWNLCHIGNYMSGGTTIALYDTLG